MPDEKPPQDINPVNPVTLVGGVTQTLGIKNPLPPWVSPDTWEQNKAGLQYIIDGYDGSEKDIDQSIAGHKSYLGLLSNEDLMSQYSDSAVDQARKSRVDRMDEQHVMDWLWAGKTMYSTIPYLKQTGSEVLAGSGTGLAVGAAAGATATAPAATIAAPFTGGLSLPAGEVSGAVVGGSGGAILGGRAAIMHSAFVLGSGQTYFDLIKRGASPTVAREAATAAGGIGAVMQAWFFRGGAVKFRPLDAKFVQATADVVFKRAAQVFGKAIVAADVSQAAAYAAEQIALWREKKKPIEWKDILEGMAKAHAVGTLQGGIAAATHLTLSGKVVSGEGPITEKTKAIMAHIPQAVAEKEQVLAEKQQVLSVVKAEDAIQKAETKIAEAKAEGKSTKVAQAQLEVAQAKLDTLKPQPQPSETKLSGHVEKTVEEHQANQTVLMNEISKIQAQIEEAQQNQIRINKRIKLAKDQDREVSQEDEAAQKAGQAELRVLRAAEKKGFQNVSDAFNKVVSRRVALEGKIAKLERTIQAREEKHGALPVGDSDRMAVAMDKENLQLQKEGEFKMLKELKEREEQEVAKTKKKITTLLKGAVATKKGKVVKLPATKETLRILGTYRHAIENQAEAIRHISNAPLVPETTGEGAEQELEKNFIYGQVAGYDNFNSAQLKALHDQLVDIYSEGKVAQADKLLKQKEARAKEVKFFLEAAIGGWTDEEMALHKVDPTLQQKLRDKIRTMGHTVAVWEEVVDMLVQDAPMDVRKQIRGNLSFTQEEINEQADVNYWLKEFKEDAQKWTTTYDPTYLDKFLNEDIGHKQDFGDYSHKTVTLQGKASKKGSLTQVTVVPKPLAMTMDELINVAVQLDDPDAKAGFKAMGYTFKDDPDLYQDEMSFEEAVKTSIAQVPEAQAVVNALKNMYQRHGVEYAGPWYESKNGIPLNLSNKNYSGPLARDIKGEEEKLDLMAAIIDRKGLTPNSTIDRVNNSQRVRLEGAIGKYVRYVASFAHAKHMTDKAQTATAILTNPEVRKVLTDKYPTTLLGTADDAYKTIAGLKARNTEIAFRWLNQLRTNMGTAAVGAKPVQFFKQWTAFLYYGHEMPVSNLLSGIAYARAHPDEVNATFAGSKFIENRQTDLRHQMINAARGEKSLVHNKYTEGSMWFVGKGDLNVIQHAGFAYYLWYRDNVAQGTPEEKHQQALAAFENVSTGTQSSSNLSQQTQYEREGAAGRAVSLFKKQGIQVGAYTTRAIRDFVNNPSKENAATLGKAWTVNLAASLMFHLVGDVGKKVAAITVASVMKKKIEQQFNLLKDSMDLGTDAFADQFSSIPFAGGAIQAVILDEMHRARSALNLPEGQKPHELSGGLGYDQINSAVKATAQAQTITEKAMQTHTAPKLGDVMESMNSFAKAAPLTTGLPVQQGTSILKQATKEEKPKHRQKFKLIED